MAGSALETIAILVVLAYAIIWESRGE